MSVYYMMFPWWIRINFHTNFKISTNSETITLSDNTGNIIDGTSTIEDCGEKLLNFVLEVASGRVKVCARELGQNDFIPWKRGMSL